MCSISFPFSTQMKHELAKKNSEAMKNELMKDRTDRTQSNDVFELKILQTFNPCFFPFKVWSLRFRAF